MPDLTVIARARQLDGEAVSSLSVLGQQQRQPGQVSDRGFRFYGKFLHTSISFIIRQFSGGERVSLHGAWRNRVAAAVSLKVPQREEIRDYTGAILHAFQSQPFFSYLVGTLVFILNAKEKTYSK